MKTLKEALGLEEAKGRVSLFGQRFWLAHHVEFVSLRRKLEEIMGRAANGFVYREGEQTGAAYTRFIESKFRRDLERLSALDRFRFYLDWLSRIGYGRFRVEAFDERTHSASVALEDGIEAESYGEASAPVCFSTAGILGHVAGILCNCTVLTTETECRAAGSAHCEFKIRPMG